MVRLPKDNFVSNTNDDLHCYQACYKMIYDFFTGNNITIKEAELATGFILGKQTWPYQGMIGFADSNLPVISIEDFPIEHFINNPYEALKIYTNENMLAVDDIMKNSDISEAQRSIKKYMCHENITVENRIPEFYDIESLIKDSYMIITNVNSRILNDKDGYCGHFIIIDSFYSEGVVVHNPGLPPYYAQKVPYEKFNRSWMFPSVIAVKK